MVRVKICGITRSQDVTAAVAAGADAVGFIVGFPKSPRNLSLDAAEKLIKSVPPLVDSVLVTNAETLSREIERVGRIGPDAIQLHGELANQARAREKLRSSLIKVLQVKTGIRTRLKASLRGYDALLTDTYKRGYDGGTGLVSDWEECLLLRGQIHPLPMILSGGLSPGNVVEAIAKVRPYAVDASSGVESAPGIKDARKVLEFVRLAKRDVTG
jgi:phosphoribosylanthranilate isomerase